MTVSRQYKMKDSGVEWIGGIPEHWEEQRVKFVNLAESMKDHPDFKEKYKDNRDVQNREIAFAKIFDEVMMKQCKNEMDLYKLIASDSAFKSAMQDSLRRLLSA